MIYFQTWPIYINSFLTSNETYISVNSIDFSDYKTAIDYFNDLSAKSSELADEMVCWILENSTFFPIFVTDMIFFFQETIWNIERPTEETGKQIQYHE